MTGTPVTVRLGWTGSPGGLGVLVRIGDNGVHLRRRDVIFADGTATPGTWSEPMPLEPWDLCPTLVAALPDLTGDTPDGDAPVPAGSVARSVKVVLDVTVSRDDDVSLAARFWYAGRCWYAVDGPPDDAVCRPCTRRLVEVLVGHAGLHALLRSQEVPCA